MTLNRYLLAALLFVAVSMVFQLRVILQFITERIMNYSLLVGISVRESNEDLSTDEGDLWQLDRSYKFLSRCRYLSQSYMFKVDIVGGKEWLTCTECNWKVTQADNIYTCIDHGDQLGPYCRAASRCKEFYTHRLHKHNPRHWIHTRIWGFNNQSHIKEKHRGPKSEVHIIRT